MADKMMRIAGRGEDGTAKPVKTDNSGRVKVSRGEIAFSDNDLTKIELSIEEAKDIYVFENDTIIDFLSWSTNSEKIALSFHLSNNELFLGDIRSGGEDFYPATPQNIIEQMSSLYHINFYDTGNYKFTLSRRILFPKGAFMRVRNLSTSENGKVSVRFTGVQYD